MKTMTCKQLGGACDKAFHAHTELSKKHGMDMYQIGREEHPKGMSEMKELMKSPKAMKEWFENRRKEFDVLPRVNS